MAQQPVYNFGNVGPSSGRGGKSDVVKGMSWSSKDAVKYAEKGLYQVLDSNRTKGAKTTRKFNAATAFTRTYIPPSGTKGGQRATNRDIFVDSLPLSGGGLMAIRTVSTEDDLFKIYPKFMEASGGRIPPFEEVVNYGITRRDAQGQEAYFILSNRAYSARTLYGDDYASRLEAWSRMSAETRGPSPGFTAAEIQANNDSLAAGLDRPLGRVALSLDTYNRDKQARRDVERAREAAGKTTAKTIKGYSVEMIGIISKGIKDTFKEEVDFRKTTGAKKEKGLIASVRKLLESPQSHFLDITPVVINANYDVNKARKTANVKKVKRDKQSVEKNVVGDYVMFEITVNGVLIRLGINKHDGRYDDYNSERVFSVYRALSAAGFTMNDAVVLGDIQALNRAFDHTPRNYVGQQQQAPQFGGQQGGQVGGQAAAFSPRQ